ncbi:hypothetical protein CTI12_AA245630 [Artemisia annua]|uniref:UvrD-like Helicase, ATP-binding domain, P-loop containing nucleoside triphosphate hydrolase n=1 Tax=Artemisia annua TaxID=35608 RepID=A0A2U1NND7_ARTAN|nr:hypothetical protein CTI12_AA245630 [Artemisia annua]
MGKGSSLGFAAAEHHEDEFTKMILSWSLDHILDEHVYKNKVEKIPLTFESEEHYFGSFVYPLLEETRSELASSMEIMNKAPFADILSFNESKSGENMLYDVTVGCWKNQCSARGRDDYYMLLGDLLLLVDGLPESVSDLKHVGRTWALSLVKSNEDDITSLQFNVKASQPIVFQDGMFAVFLMNIESQRRIWNSLHMRRNLHIIKEILYSDSKVEKKCGICSFGYDSMVSQKIDQRLLLKMNESQRTAVMAVLCKTECCHISSVAQISGPPGTGKSMTVSVLIVILLQMKHRNLTCGPTNVAIVELASRVLNLVRESLKTTTASGDYFCSVGDLLLFGKREILKVRIDIEEIYLEHRIERLAECLGPVTGWKDCIRSMIYLLENCVCEYYNFLENEFLKDKFRNDNEGKRSMLEIKSFIEFVQVQFNYLAPPLRRCIVTFCTHVPRSFMGEYIFLIMISLLDNLSSLEYLLFQKNLVSEELEDLFNSKPLQDDVVTQCLSLLKTLQISLEGLALPCFSNKYAIKQFCFERACVIFCTTSSSYKLHAVNMEPFNILVIDEAAQLKEAESTIPLQLPGMKHAILIGDECQLPAVVKSNICIKSGFGRSLFERLSSLGHSMHLLNVQYRMHPSISLFPNLKFYKNKVLDAQNVLSKSYEKRHLSGPMFGSYSFINVVGGREELDDDGKSRRNMVEVAIVIKIVKFLYRAWQDSKKKLSIGVISPYAAQVISIQEKLAHKYEKLDGFSVKVRSIDGFQGGEEDIIFSRQHCLWILGNEKTLSSSESIWKELVFDARNRHCFFDADADECLKTIIIAAIKELDQLDDLVNGNSVLFKHAKWKVLFSDDFRRSFAKLTGSRLKKQVLNLLLKLSSAWRPKNRSTDFCCKSSSQILKQFKVEGLYVICTNDIIKEVKYVQVLKVWDVLALDEIPKLTKRLESIFSAYTDAYIRNVNPGDARIFVENSEVSEILLLMKFYSFSCGVVSHLLSGKEADLPMQVTDEQMDIILSPKSSFIIGRSGTGKTTILTMKLFQCEQKFRVASDGIYEGGNNRFRGDKVLHQLFVTVSPKLCYAVKQNVSHLTSVSSHVNSSAEINHNDTNVITSEVNDIPDTFTNIPVRNYPLVITFQKFLMMLDDKGLVSEISQLKQNFRTHAAVLDLAQSVIDIIYHYFIHLIDKLEPEISLISGEAPVLLESGSDENAIVTIFGDTGASEKIAGFGADQVILVRDDGAKTEICEYVGKNALVLTILECKGLEFHDVLLYNFFGTSPLKDQWRVIYGYMKKHNLLNEKLPQSFPTFDEARHSVLCSELKQLYVAITRTRQRLWICENKEELSKPMFNYWKMKGLVQVRELDDSVAQSMRVASTPQEWLDRGKKFFYESNFVMSTLCFEKAGDTMWEKLAKASSLRASADQMWGTNHDAFVSYAREAGEMFESIGKLESAASCYCDLGDYERAGNLYLHKCGKIDAAAECFTLSGCYREAAEAYAKGDQFANCLSVCKKGKLFNEGLEYIKNWKEHVNVRCREMRQIEEFLENCALYYHEHKDPKTMMKFVTTFCSMESKRVFLRSLGCLDDLLSLEEDLGLFLEAAQLARSCGDILKEADLLEKAGHFKDATENVDNILENLGIFHNEEPNKHEGHVDFSLIYFGVRKQCVNGNTVYLLVNKDADWIKNYGQKGVQRDGTLLTIDIGDLVFAIRSYWQSELLSVGIKVLETLERLLHMSKSNGSAFHQSTSLLHIFEVTKFLLDCQHVNLTSPSKKKLQSFLKISTSYFDLVFPLDWRNSVSEDLISVRKTDLSVNLLNEIILQYINIKGDLTYWTIGRVMMICFSCTQPLVLFEMVMRKIQNAPSWKLFLEKFWNDGKKDTYVSRELKNALEDTFKPKCPGHVSPHSFMYLLDHLLFFASLSSEIIFTTRSSLVGWLTSFDSTGTLNTSLSVSKQTIPDRKTLRSIVKIVKIILFHKDDIVSWISRSKIDASYYHPILALKGVMILSLLCLQASDCSQELLELLSGDKSIAQLLPNKFVANLLSRRKGSLLNLNSEVVSEAFLSIEDPLLIMCSGDVNPKINAPCAIFVDLTKSKEEITSELFLTKTTLCVQNPSNNDGCEMSPKATCSDTLPVANLDVNPVDECKGEQQTNRKVEDEIFEILTGKKEKLPSLVCIKCMIRKEFNRNINTLATALTNGNQWPKEDMAFVFSALSELKAFSEVLNKRAKKAEDHSVSEKTLQEVLKWLQSNTPKINDIMNRSAMNQESEDGKMLVSENSNTTEVDETSEKNHNEETGDDDSLVKVVLENNTQEVKIKKVKGNNKGKKGKKGKAGTRFNYNQLVCKRENSCKTAKKAEDHSVSEKTLQEVLKWLQSNTPKINDIMNRSAMNQESEDGKMLVSENSNTTEVDETSEKNHNEETGDDDSLVKVVLENNTQEVKIKKVKGNNKGKKGKKSKGI